MSAAEIGFGILLVVAALVAIALGEQNRLLKKRILELGIQQRTLQHNYELVRLSEARLKLLTDAAFDALMIVDAEKRVVIINNTARDLFHVPTSGVLTLMGVTRQHELDELVDEILKSGEALDSQVEIKDHTFRVSGSIVDLSGDKPAVILALQNITDLIRATRARRDMVANFSHDLRTPISSVRLLLEDLTRRYGRNPEKDREVLGKLAGQTDSLEHMTRELLDLSMIESGKSIVRMVRVNLNDILNDALNTMNAQIEEKNLHIINEITETMPVLADPDATKRVLNNIIHNAVKFTKPGGMISFNAACNDSIVTVRVRDTGPGIPPQDRTRVFERFYQVDSSRTGHVNGGGSGLGLSIAKHIVEAQGGRIWAEAAIPQGACLCFTVPLAEPPKSARP